jgi:hypothetical protein
VDKVEARAKLSFPTLIEKGYSTIALDFSNTYQNPLEALSFG